MTDNKSAIDQVQELYKVIDEAIFKCFDLQDDFAKEMHTRAVAFMANPTIEAANDLSDIHNLAAWMVEYGHTSQGDSVAEMEDTHVTNLYFWNTPGYDQAEKFYNDITDKMVELDPDNIDDDEDLDSDD